MPPTTENTNTKPNYTFKTIIELEYRHKCRRELGHDLVVQIHSQLYVCVRVYLCRKKKRHINRKSEIASNKDRTVSTVLSPNTDTHAHRLKAWVSSTHDMHCLSTHTFELTKQLIFGYSITHGWKLIYYNYRHLRRRRRRCCIAVVCWYIIVVFSYCCHCRRQHHHYRCCCCHGRYRLQWMQEKERAKHTVRARLCVCVYEYNALRKVENVEMWRHITCWFLWSH